MMNIVIAPDKFKGSLNSFELCEAIARGILMVMPGTNIISLPMADGGDGFASVMAHYTQSEIIYCSTVNALGKPINASYRWSEIQKTAIIEMASASGVALLNDNEKNPLLASSFGTGLLLKHAIEKGAETIILGLGGTATNDGGTGILSALGYQFKNTSGEVLGPNGKNLALIKHIFPPVKNINIEIILACDVTNPMTGPNGATLTFAKQKGRLSQQEIDMLETAMIHFANLLETFTGRQLQNIPGLGAAGATGAGLMLLNNVSLQGGLSIVVNASNIAEHIQNADLVITAEGAFDAQTLHGKVVYGIAQLARKAGKPVVAICGQLNASTETIKACGLDYITSICNGPMSIEESMANASQLCSNAVAGIMQLVAAMYNQQNHDRFG